MYIPSVNHSSLHQRKLKNKKYCQAIMRPLYSWHATIFILNFQILVQLEGDVIPLHTDLNGGIAWHVGAHGTIPSKMNMVDITKP